MDICKKYFLDSEIMNPHIYTGALIGGHPMLREYIIPELKVFGIHPLESFSERVTVEEITAEGMIKKVSYFKHMFFVELDNISTMDERCYDY